MKIRETSWNFVQIRANSWKLVKLRETSWKFVQIRENQEIGVFGVFLSDKDRHRRSPSGYAPNYVGN